MAGQYNQQEKRDMETAAEQSKELKRKKRMKFLAYATAFAIFQTIVILVFSLTVMRIKNPKFRVGSITIEDLTYASSSNSPSFNMKFSAEVAIKNTNFGHFKFDNVTISFDFEGFQVGEAFVEKGKAKARSTKKMDVIVVLNSNDTLLAKSNFASDTSSGILTLTSHSKLNGKVHLMKLIKKKTSAQMKCSIAVDVVSRAIQDIECK